MLDRMEPLPFVKNIVQIAPDNFGSLFDKLKPVSELALGMYISSPNVKHLRFRVHLGVEVLKSSDCFEHQVSLVLVMLSESISGVLIIIAFIFH